MNKYKSDNYKISAVKYYLSHIESLEQVCNIFGLYKTVISKMGSKI